MTTAAAPAATPSSSTDRWPSPPRRRTVRRATPTRSHSSPRSRSPAAAQPRRQPGPAAEAVAVAPAAVKGVSGPVSSGSTAGLAHPPQGLALILVAGDARDGRTAKVHPPLVNAVRGRSPVWAGCPPGRRPVPAPDSRPRLPRDGGCTGGADCPGAFRARLQPLTGQGRSGWLRSSRLPGAASRESPPSAQNRKARRPRKTPGESLGLPQLVSPRSAHPGGALDQGAS